jgi:hypothetical protein
MRTRPLFGWWSQSRRSLGLLAAVCAAIASAIASFVTVGHLARRVLELINTGRPITVPAVAAAFGWTDATVVALTVLSVTLLVWVELRNRAITALLCTGSRAQILLLLITLVAWLGHAYLFPGLLTTGDMGSHIARFHEVRLALEAGEFPAWSNYQYLGVPLLEFTGPLTYIVGGVIDVGLKDAEKTTKVILFFGHIGAGLFYYALLVRLRISRAAALIVTVGVTGSFAYMHLFLYRGVLPQVFTILFFILLFYAAEILMSGPRLFVADWLLVIVATVGLIVNHQPHALFAAFYLVLFGGVSLLTGRWQLSRIPYLISAAVFGAVISAPAVIPVILGRDWVMISPEDGFFHLTVPTVGRLLHLAVWGNSLTTFGTDYWAYIGITLILLGAIGAAAALTRRLDDTHRHLALAILPCLGCCLVLSNPVVRDVIFIVFFLGLLAALGAEAIIRNSGATSRASLLVLAAVFVDVGSTSIQPVARTDKQHLVDAGTYLERIAPNERVLEVVRSRDGRMTVSIGPGGGPMSVAATVQRIAGNHNMAATPLHNYVETAAKLAERDLRERGRLSATSETLMAILHVSRIVCFGPVVNGCPEQFAGATIDGPLGAVLPVPESTPVLFARRLSSLMPPVGLDKPMLWDPDFATGAWDPRAKAVEVFLHQYLQAADIDLRTGTAATLPVRIPAPELPREPMEPGLWSAKLQRYSVSLQRVDLIIEATGDGYAQLSHPWYPANRVLVNGARIQPLQGAFDFIVLPIHAGTNAIQLQGRVTPALMASAWISKAGLMGVIVVAGFVASRRRLFAETKASLSQPQSSGCLD